MRSSRLLLLTTLLTLAPILIYAADEDHGWSFSERFSGSANAAGVITKANSTVGYRINDHVNVYTGLPVYFVHPKSGAGAQGVGNAFAGFTVSEYWPALDYSSDVIVSAPTGDQARGFSTGRMTADWTNTFSHTFNSVTPFASAGIANTVSDTAFFVRPFSSKGTTAHFEVGSLFDVAPHVTIGGSVYGVRAHGEQEIVSKVSDQPSTDQQASQPSQQQSLLQGLGVGRSRRPAPFEQQTVTTGEPVLANDSGISTWLTLKVSPSADFQVGYTHSAPYQLNSLFFGLGFRVGH